MVRYQITRFNPSYGQQKVAYDLFVSGDAIGAQREITSRTTDPHFDATEWMWSAMEYRFAELTYGTEDSRTVTFKVIDISEETEITESMVTSLNDEGLKVVLTSRARKDGVAILYNGKYFNDDVFRP